MNNILKNIFIATYLIFGYGAFFERLNFYGFSIKGIVFVFLFLLVVLGLFTVSRIQNNFIRIICGLLFFMASFGFLMYENISNSFLEYNSFISLYNALSFIDEAVKQYYNSMLIPIIYGLLIFFAVALKPSKISTFWDKIFGLTSFSVFVFLLTFLYFFGGRGAKGLPPSYNLALYSSLALYENYTGTLSKREDVKIKRSRENNDFDIILIVDESISPFYMDINSDSGVLTNLMARNDSVKIYNYGFAASITNCSSESNQSLRFGGKRDNYLKALNQLPSIWRYAKEASLKTIYIDGQLTEGELMNGMSRNELLDIDKFIQFDTVQVMNRDMAIADKLVELIENDTKEFIYVNKVGAHFPIHDKYPDEYTIYKPILPRGKYAHIVNTTGSFYDFKGSVDDWVLYRNSYRNTLVWNVGTFFDKILSKTKLENTIIIYTSDHGQDLHENGNPGLGTHCSSNPSTKEGIVPLIVMEGLAETLDWEHNFSNNRNRVSHYNIFPTLLSLMSYDADQISSIYGSSLYLNTFDEMTFNVNYHSRLGSKPRWKKIKLDLENVQVFNE